MTRNHGKAVKTIRRKCATTLNLCVHLVHALSILMGPFLPFTAEKLWKASKPGRQGGPSTVVNCRYRRHYSRSSLWTRQKFFSKKLKTRQLTRKLKNCALAQAEIQDIRRKPLTQQPNPELTLRHFAKVDLRAAKILTAEPIPKAKKLLRLTIDLGTETRQLVAGLAEFYQAEELIGKTVAVVANLEPATIRGVASDGMLLAASGDGRLVIIISGVGSASRRKNLLIRQIEWHLFGGKINQLLLFIFATFIYYSSVASIFFSGAAGIYRLFISAPDFGKKFIDYPVLD